MSLEELETLEYLYEKAKRMHLSSFKFNGDFIDLAVAKKMIKKARR